MFPHPPSVRLWLLLAFYLSMPSQSLWAADEDGDKTASKEVQSIARSNNQFAFDLYAKLRSSESGNLFFSPTSISTALAMTYAGSAGDTEKEMTAVLRFKLPKKQVHPAFAALMATLNAPNKDV